MTSTKKCNQKNDYICEQLNNQNTLSYLINTVYSEQKKPCQMFVLGSNPSKMNSHHFSYNPIDIESRLRGINSCNLEGSSFQPELQKKDFYTQDIFENHLKNNIYVPRPFYHNSNVRSGFHNI